MNHLLTRPPEGQPFYSYHVFFFPFKWKYPRKEQALLEEQTSLETLTALLGQPSSKWSQDHSWKKYDTLSRYNEAAYFYDFVREALYDMGKDDSILRHYRYKLPQNPGYHIDIKDKKSYELEIDDILLHLYTTGVGVISFHLYNREHGQSGPEDILLINQFGRRVYPPFYATDYNFLGQQVFFEDENWARGLQGTKAAELPDRIWLSSNGDPFVIEDFHTFRPTPPNLESLPRYITELFDPLVFKTIQIETVLDDRMFVLCWYGNQQLAEALGKRASKKIEAESPNYAYESHDWWYRFVFLDTGYKTCQNDVMTLELLKAHTNGRWANYGTFYGGSRYSFVCLTSHIDALNGVKYLVSHMQTMYYKMAELCLLQRACMLRFADEVTEISRLKEDKRLTERVSSLYKQYIWFVNKIYFREVTAQEQGIELYDLLQRSMRLDGHIKDLDGEIQELHQYVLIREDERRNRSLALLTSLGAFFVIPSFVVGYMGMNIIQAENGKPAGWHFSLLAALLILGLLIFGFIKVSKTWQRVALALLFLAGLVTLLDYLI